MPSGLLLLTSNQVEAACQLHETLPRWALADAALRRVRERIAGFDEPACLVKVVAVNDLYGTNVLATVALAQSMSRILAQKSTFLDDGLVSKLAVHSSGPQGRVRNFTSFASKFCHFFIDEHHFPIYDEAAREAIRAHLGAAAIAGGKQPYPSFCASFRKLQLQLKCTTKALDHYLWLGGMYLRWASGTAKAKLVNRELAELFERPGERAQLLDAALATLMKRKPAVARRRRR
jgi:hypothetical protein